MLMFSLDNLLFDHCQFTLIHGSNIPGSYAVLFFIASEFISITITSTSGCCFCLTQRLQSFFSYFSTLLQQHIGDLSTWGVQLSASYLFAFSYSSWASQDENTEVACHSLLHWTTFSQNSPPWCVCLGWTYMAWLILTWHSVRLVERNTAIMKVFLIFFLNKCDLDSSFLNSLYMPLFFVSQLFHSCIILQ